MASGKMNNALRITILVVLGIITISAFGIGSYEFARTLTPPWPLAGATAGAALVTAFATSAMWGPLLGIENRIVATVVGFIMFTGLLGGSFLCINHNVAGANPDTEIHAAVEKKLTKTRYRQRRVGRRVVGREPYKVYYIKFRFHDGREADIQTSLSYYNKVRQGDSVSLTLRTGVFGLPVITDQLR